MSKTDNLILNLRPTNDIIMINLTSPSALIMNPVEKDIIHAPSEKGSILYFGSASFKSWKWKGVHTLRQLKLPMPLGLDSTRVSRMRLIVSQQGRNSRSILRTCEERECMKEHCDQNDSGRTRLRCRMIVSIRADCIMIISVL